MSNAIKINVNGTWKDVASSVGTKGSLKLDGNSDYIPTPDHADFTSIGTGNENMTINFFFKFISAPSYPWMAYLFAHNRNIPDQAWVKCFYNYENEHGHLVFCFYDVGISNFVFPANFHWTLDTNWHHLAIVRTKVNSIDSLWGTYLDGVQKAYRLDAYGNLRDCNTNSIFTIGWGKDIYTAYMNGYIDEFSFDDANIFGANPQEDLSDVITVPTAEFASTSDKKTLLHLNTNLTDSTGRHTWTGVGTAQIDHAIYKDLSGASSLKVNINGVWKTIAGMQININGTWKTVF